MNGPPSRELTRQERAAIRKLVTDLCANHDNQDRLCLPLDCPCYMLHKWWTGSFCRYFQEAVLPVETVFSGYKEIRSGDASMDRLLRNGNPFRFQMDGEASLEDPFRVYDSTGLFIGIYRFSEEKRMFYPVKIFLS